MQTPSPDRFRRPSNSAARTLRAAILLTVLTVHGWALHSWAATPETAVLLDSAAAGDSGNNRIALRLSRSNAANIETAVETVAEPRQQRSVDTDVAVIPPKQEALTAAMLKKENAIPPPVSASPVIAASAIEEPTAEKTRDIVDAATPEQPGDDQTRTANNPHSGGAHQQPIISEPVFAAPPQPPRYPTIARKRGQQGTVWLDVWLDAEGQQSKLTIFKSSGLAVFDDSALAAVAQWQFKPYQLNGQQLSSRLRIPVAFSLN